MTQLRDIRILVLGLGETGRSLLRWLDREGASIRAADSRDAPPSLEELREQYPDVEFHCGAFNETLLDDIELIALSPGISLNEPVLLEASMRDIPIVGDIELLAWQLAEDQRKQPIVIAITGANGKTTVTSMVGAMCRAAGLDTAVAGNISPAVLDVLAERDGEQPDVWVLELSSFQLETTYTLNPDAATVLNISEDHLDRYDGMDEYIAAKARIFEGDGSQILNRDDAASMGMALPGRAVVTFGLTLPTTESDWGLWRHDGKTWLTQGRQRVMNAAELRVAGLHNAANALAALALCRAVDLPLEPLLDALRAFRGLSHRVERVAEIGGVSYYDDSKGTNVGATVAALTGLGCRCVLIAGGEGKGQDFSPLAPVVAAHARAVVLIGRDADLIAAALGDSKVPLARAADMDAAVKTAAGLAQAGDAVLLSPACASFDMFRNYEHRAKVFVEAVRNLEEQWNKQGGEVTA